MEKEKLAKPDSMTLTNPLERIAMRRGMVGTTEAISAGDRGAVMGAEVQGHLARAQPYEGSNKGSNSGLYGSSSATN